MLPWSRTCSELGRASRCRCSRGTVSLPKRVRLLLPCSSVDHSSPLLIFCSSIFWKSCRVPVGRGRGYTLMVWLSESERWRLFPRSHRLSLSAIRWILAFMLCNTCWSQQWVDHVIFSCSSGLTLKIKIQHGSNKQAQNKYVPFTSKHACQALLSYLSLTWTEILCFYSVFFERGLIKLIRDKTRLGFTFIWMLCGILFNFIIACLLTLSPCDHVEEVRK